MLILKYWTNLWSHRVKANKICVEMFKCENHVHLKNVEIKQI